MLGTVTHVDPEKKVISWAGPEGASGKVGYDRLILTAGSVNKLLPLNATTRSTSKNRVPDAIQPLPKDQ